MRVEEVSKLSFPLEDMWECQVKFIDKVETHWGGPRSKYHEHSSYRVSEGQCNPDRLFMWEGGI